MPHEHAADDRKQIVYNPEDRDWTARYDDHLVGIFPKLSQARQALDAFASDLARRGPAAPPPLPAPACEPVGDPLALYGPGGPDAAQPVDAAHLDAALAHFCATYDQPRVQERARRARALLAHPDRWTIQPAGAVQIVGKTSTYRVTDEACRTVAGKDCPDQKYRTGLTGGQCYHTISRELLRLAQVLARLPAPAPLAVGRLPGRLLGLAIAIVSLAEQPVLWHLDAGRLTLRVSADPPLHEVRLAGCDGAGAAALELAAADLAALWGVVRPVATQLPHMQVVVDAGARQLRLTADDFLATAPGTPR